MISSLRRLIGCRRGATAVEYGFILALVCVTIIAVISTVGGKTVAMWSNMAAKVPVVQG